MASSSWITSLVRSISSKVTSISPSSTSRSSFAFLPAAPVPHNSDHFPPVYLRYKNTTAQTDKFCLVNAHFLRNGIGCFKSNAPDIICQAVWIFFYNGNAFASIGFIDLGSMGSADFVALKEQHNIFDLFLVLPAGFDPFCPHFPIPGTLISSSGVSSIISSVFSPNFSTIFLAKTGPIPLTRPDPRYFSIPYTVAGSVSSKRSAQNCLPYLAFISRSRLKTGQSPHGYPA